MDLVNLAGASVALMLAPRFRLTISRREASTGVDKEKLLSMGDTLRSSGD